VISQGESKGVDATNPVGRLNLRNENNCSSMNASSMSGDEDDYISGGDDDTISKDFFNKDLQVTPNMNQ